MTGAEEAIDNYIKWELCKQEGIQQMIREGSKDGEKLKKEVIEKVRREYQETGYSLYEKKEKLQELDSNPEYRMEVFESCSWTKETIKADNLGTTLPHAGDLPPEAITGTLPEAVEFVKQADPEEYQSVKYIMNLKRIPEVLNEFYPWVLDPGNRQSKRDRIDRAHIENDWNIADTWGMISDGIHRAIAKVLANHSKEIECYIGYRTKSNN